MSWAIRRRVARWLVYCACCVIDGCKRRDLQRVDESWALGMLAIYAVESGDEVVIRSISGVTASELRGTETTYRSVP